MRPSTVFSGFVAVVLFGLAGCGSDESSNGGTGGFKQEGGATAGSVALGSGGHTASGVGGGLGAAGAAGSLSGSMTGGMGAASTTGAPGTADAGISQTPDAPMAGGSGGNSGTGGRSTGTTAPLGGSTGSGGTTSTGALPIDAGASSDAAVTCPGPNPAAVACRASATSCVPSSCGCVADIGWQCTADCRTSLPVCPDAGTTPDTGTSSDTRNSGIPCGKTFCSSDEFCCNPNCSQCAPTGGACTNQACQPPEIWACASDKDCTLVDDYCGGCNCRAFGPGGQLGTCGTGQADCFVAPCSMRIARCQNGVCTAVGK